MKKENERFFTQEKCDRCNSPLTSGRTMSWFTEECICMSCSLLEKNIKQQLPNGGSSYEGCGYVPEITFIGLK